MFGSVYLGQENFGGPQSVPRYTTGIEETGQALWQSIAPPTVTSDFNFGSPTDNYGYCSIVLDPTDQSIIVGTCFQGLWKSSNQGSTWAKINTGTGGSLMDGGKIWALEIDPFNHLNLWAAAGDSGVGPYKSTDGGVSWAIVTLTGPPASAPDPYSIKFDPYTADHILIAWHSGWASYSGNSGVSETTDAGATWTHYTPTTSPAWTAGGNACFFLDTSSHWLMVTNGNIWRTTNNGSTWTQVIAQNISHGASNCLTRVGTTWYIAVQTDVLYSNDNGATWTATTGSGLIGGGNISCVVPTAYDFYTAMNFPLQTYMTGQWYTMRSNGTVWSSFSGITATYTDPFFNGPNSNGPVAAVYDSVNHIGYVSCYLGGVWKLTGV